ncbi:hypothetical protein IV203_006097 [Nitzschia inconspicua]|uniref:Uncharacterized protein n=1 Tax=Nitzschia inconspicua TaxID=303405 RepID=A0A9K3KQ27_9STRA|nr:hypothetical protein IV203_006097 [Nitzschia inconspicua]
MVQARLGPRHGRSSPEFHHSTKSRSHSPPIRARPSGISRMLSPLNIHKQHSPTEQNTDLKSLSIPKLLTVTTRSEDVVELRNRVAEYERRMPHLERTIRQLEKQLDIAKDSAERWKNAAHIETAKTGSHYQQQIVELQEQLEEQIELIQERDLAIENLTAVHLHNSPSQNTSVCSSFLEEADNLQSHEMERLLKENSVYAHRLLEQEDEIVRLRREKVEGERERVALGKKVAALTKQQSSQKNEVEILKRESVLLESQVSALKKELSEVKWTEGGIGDSVSSHSSFDHTTMQTMTSRCAASASVVDTPYQNVSHVRDSNRNMKRLMELQNELRKVARERDASRKEIDQLRQERISLCHELEQTRQANNEEVKKLRTDLWKAKVLAESMDEMVMELDQTKSALQGSQRAADDTASSLRAKFREMNQTIVRLQAEIRKRDAALSDMEKSKEEEREMDRYLYVQYETRSLKTELDGALVDLERASMDQTEQKKKIQGLQSTLRTRNDTILKLQRDLKSRTENLLKARRDLVEKDNMIKAMEDARTEAVTRSSEDVESLRKKLSSKDNEIERLQQELITRGSTLANARSEVASLKANIEQIAKERETLPAAETSARAQFEREILELNKKLSLLQQEIIEKDIVIEDLEAELSSKYSLTRTECHPSGRDTNAECPQLQRGFITIASKVPSSQKERSNTDIQLSLQNESIAESEGKVQDPSSDPELPLLQIRQLEENRHNDQQLRNQVESLKVSCYKLNQELVDKNGIIAKKSASIDKLHLEIHREKQSLRELQEELKRKEAETAEGLVQSQLTEKAIEIRKLQNDLETIQSKNKNLQEKLDEKERRLVELESCVAKFEDKHLDLASETERLRKELTERDDCVVKLEALQKVIADSLENAMNEIARKSDDQAKLELLLKKKGDDVEDLLLELEAHKETIDGIRHNLEDRESKNVELVSLNEEIQLALQRSREECLTLNKEKNDLSILVQEIEAEAVRLRSNLEEADRQINLNSQQLSEMGNSKKLLIATLEQASSELTRMRTESASTRRDLQERNDKNEDSVENLKAQLDEVYGQLEERSVQMRERDSSQKKMKDLFLKTNKEKEILEAVIVEKGDSLQTLERQNRNLVLEVESMSVLVENAKRERDEVFASKSQACKVLNNEIERLTSESEALAKNLNKKDLKIEELEARLFCMNSQNTQLSDGKESVEGGTSRGIVEIQEQGSQVAPTNLHAARGNSGINDGTIDRGLFAASLDTAKNDTLTELIALKWDLQAKNSRLRKLDSTKLKLVEQIIFLEEQVTLLSVENRNLSDELALQYEQQLQSRQAIDNENIVRQQSLDDIRHLIKEGLESIRQLEHVKLEASTESLELRLKHALTLQEMEVLNERVMTSERQLSKLQQQVENKDLEAQETREATCRDAVDVIELRQTLSSEVGESNVLKNEIQSHLDDDDNRCKQLTDATAENDALNLMKQDLEIALEDMKNKFVSLASEKISVEEELNLSREEVARKDSALAEFRKASSDSLEARDILRQKLISTEEQLKQARHQVTSRTKNLVKARHELMSHRVSLEKAQRKLTEKEEEVKWMETKLKENNSLKLENERIKEENESGKKKLISILEENKRLKADTERKKFELKEVSEEAENIKMNFMRQHEELKKLSDDNQTLKKTIENKEAEVARMHRELIERSSNAESLNDVKSKMNEAFNWAIRERKERELVTEESALLVSKSKKMHEELATLREENEVEKSTNFQLSQELEEKNKQIHQLGKELEICKQALAEATELQVSNSQLLRELEEKNVFLEEKLEKCEDLNQVNADLESRVEELMVTVGDLNLEISNIKEESFMDASFESLKSELQEVKKSGDEKIQAYERQICALTMNKDVTIDTLRKDLATARSRSAEEIARLTSELSKVREQNRELEIECNNESIRLRDQRIYALEHTLCAQEKTVDCLRAELDQLRLSMANTAEQRRRELEELQKELMDSQSNLQQRVRECTALKSQLDDCKLRYEEDVEELNREIERLKSSSSSKKSLDLRQSSMMAEVKARLEQLKETNIELKEQNTQLAARLQRASEKVKNIEAEKEAVVEMEEECAELRRQVKDLEGQLESLSGSTSKSGSISKSRASESTFSNPPKEASNESKGLGLGIGRRKSKIPSVLFIGKSKESSS